MNSDIWVATNFSKTFDGTGNIDIGQNSSFVTGVFTFGIGETVTIFQDLGKYEFLMQLLIICVSGSARWSVTNLTNLAGMTSGPVEQSEHNDLIHLRTCPWETGLRLKGLATDGFTSARVSTRHSMLSKDTAFDPIVLSAVVRVQY